MPSEITRSDEFKWYPKGTVPKLKPIIPARPTPPLMKCGHTANAHTQSGKPCCVICWGLSENREALEVYEEPPELGGREAECADCGKKKPSALKLPFFKHDPKRPTDSFYCGCRGWD